MFRTLVLSAGNLHGIVFVGAMDVLERAGCLKSLTTIVGSSAGAVIGTAIAIGYNSRELMELFMPLVCVRGLPCIGPGAVHGLASKLGASDSGFVRGVMSDMLAKKIRPQVTFEELRTLRGIDLRICVSNVTSGAAQILSSSSHPNMPVVDALVMTTAIPLLFRPVIYEGQMFIDGGVYNHLPTDMVTTNDPASVLVLSVDRSLDQRNPTNPLGLLHRMFWSMVAERYERNAKLFANTVVFAATGAANMFGKVSVLRSQRVTMPVPYFKSLVRLGELRMRGFLTERGPTDISHSM
jgi:predicted acylesterase/phospholipase RssA